MKPVFEKLGKIAVFRALQLGDMLCAVPALRALRSAYPDAEITMIGLPWQAAFVERFSDYLDNFIHFPGYPGLPEQEFNRENWPAFVDKINDQNFDLMIQMQGNGNIVNSMLKEFFPVVLAGFHSEGNRLDTDLFLEYPEGISEIERHLALTNHLGIVSLGNELEFPIYQLEIENLVSLNLPIQKKQYVCVHPGSRGSWRQWPISFFAKIADEVSSFGFDIVITGTKDESAITKEVLGQMKSKAIDLAGKTGLGEAGQLIKDAAMLISNCTGVSHMAAATETPSIVISMDGEPERWGPLNKQLHRTIDWTKNQNYEVVREETIKLLKDQIAER